MTFPRATSAAYGGDGWSPRTKSHKEEIGTIWANCGVDNEWSRLEIVMLHQPGEEIALVTDPNQAQFLALPDPGRFREQHDMLAQFYRDEGISVVYVNPNSIPPPNLVFTADTFLMTPEGVILGRPASTVRAGEEKLIAHRLAELNLPVLRTIRGQGTFEGADAVWINPTTVLIGCGLRTNHQGAIQVRGILEEMGINVFLVDLPHNVMHLMGCLRIIDFDLAIAWPGRFPLSAAALLQDFGIQVIYIPDEGEAIGGHALNFVTLGPKRILIPSGIPITQKFYEKADIECSAIEVDEILKAAGGIACMTGILARIPAQKNA